MCSDLVLSNKSSHVTHGSIKKILSRRSKDFFDTILIESPFRETTRDGKDIIGVVRLALTSKAFVIASGERQFSQSEIKSELSHENSSELFTLYPWTSVKLSVFKKSERKCIKALFFGKSRRYFVLQEIPKMKIHWELWCRYIKELNSSKKKWPFEFHTIVSNKRQHLLESDSIDIYVIKHKKKKYPLPKWTDKYLYLGSIREAEDQIRPRPVPGLGKTEEIKLLYLKPRYFGCWEQSEHWVQCGESSSEFACQNID